MRYDFRTLNKQEIENLKEVIEEYKQYDRLDFLIMIVKGDLYNIQQF